MTAPRRGAGLIEAPDDQTMLALSMLSYRAFHDLRPGELRLAHLRSSILQGLEEIPPVTERFDLVWGPAAYRAPFTLFDQNVMFVVKDRERARYVVVVRGTNPVSPIDWIFGDLWTGIDIRWPFGAKAGHPDARVSLSTHLAISILRHLRSSGPRPTPTERIWRMIDSYPGDIVRRSFRAALHRLGPPISAGMRRLRMDLRSDLQLLRANTTALQAASSLEDRVAALAATRASAPARRIIERVGARDSSAADEAQRELVRVLEGTFRLRSRLAPGADLVHFLRSALDDSEDEQVDLVVTGHSKGGALSATLALWLAQTQGVDGVRRVEQWDPGHRAVVSCWSYAGPTAGNSEFAALSDEVLGTRCHRISNRLDMVPHAWQVRPGGRKAAGFYIENVPQLYGKGVHSIKGLGALARAVARDVRPLEYRHIGGSVTVLDGKVDPSKTLFAEQVAYQHMDAYLIELGLSEHADPATFLGLHE